MNTMNSEKRQGKAAIPDDLGKVLNPAQMRSLRQIENFGWQLVFIRQPLFQEPIPVVINSKGDRIGILEADGRINLQAAITLREETLDVEPDDSCTGC